MKESIPNFTEFREQFQQPMQRIAEELVPILKSISHEKRLAIMIELLGEKKSFSWLLQKSQLKKTALSHHLQVLLTSNLIYKPEYARYHLTSDGLTYLRSLFNTSMKIAKDKMRKIQSRPISNEFLNRFRGN